MTGRGRGYYYQTLDGAMPRCESSMKYGIRSPKKSRTPMNDLPVRKTREDSCSMADLGYCSIPDDLSPHEDFALANRIRFPDPFGPPNNLTREKDSLSPDDILLTPGKLQLTPTKRHDRVPNNIPISDNTILVWSPSKGQGIDRRIEPNRFRHTEAAIDRLSLKDVVANSRIDVDNILAGLKKDIEIGTMREIMKELHQKALTDRQFSIKLSIVARPDVIKRKDELNVAGLQIILVRTLLLNFRAREKLKAMDRKQYRNALSLLGEFYHRFRVADAAFYQLSKSIIDWLCELLKDTEEEDVELVARQLSINGQLLKDEAPADLDGLVNCVKRLAIKPDMSEKSKTLLSLVLSLDTRDFAPLTGDVRDFYVKQLGKYTFENIEFCDRYVTQNQVYTKPTVLPMGQNSRSAMGKPPRQSHNYFGLVGVDSYKRNRTSNSYDPRRPITCAAASRAPILATLSEDSVKNFFLHYSKNEGHERKPNRPSHDRAEQTSHDRRKKTRHDRREMRPQGEKKRYAAH